MKSCRRWQAQGNSPAPWDLLSRRPAKKVGTDFRPPEAYPVGR